jgi:hypothetical protein
MTDTPALDHLDLDLRRSDPTLSASTLGLVALQLRDAKLIAHRWDSNSPGVDYMICGRHERGLRGMEPHHAAYIAIVCPTCFPGAPPPGTYPIGECNCGALDNGVGIEHEPGCGFEPDPYLRWQMKDQR